MAKGTGPTNSQLQSLVMELKKKAIQENAPIWKRIATDLEKSTRRRRIVNLSRINRFTKDSDVIIVPGKVLGSGMLDHKLTIAAFSFSEGAVEKLKANKCDVLSIPELIQKKPKSQDIRIIG